MGAVSPAKRCTLTDVARAAQVSRSAAFAALNEEHGTNIGISQERRQRVLEAARKLGYARNDLARSLVSGKSKMVGILVPSLATQFFSGFFTAFDDACYADGYTVFVTSSEFNRERESRNLQAFLNRRMDAVVVACGQLEDHADLLAQLRSQGVAVLMLGTVDTPGVDYMAAGFDEAGIGNLAARHLHERGHRKVLYFGADEAADNSARIHAIRRAHFATAWQRCGNRLRHLRSDDPLHGGQAVAAWLAEQPRAEWPTAVVCATDLLALSVMSALHVQGIAVPGTLSVVGCDDIPLAGLAPMPLTTVRLPTDALAREVWRLLAAGMAEPPAGRLPRRVLIAPEWIERASVATVQPLASE